MVHSADGGPAFWVNVVKPFVRGVGKFRVSWLLPPQPTLIVMEHATERRRVKMGNDTLWDM